MKLREILTDEEWEHVLETADGELGNFVRNRRHQLALFAQSDHTESCWRCRAIAKKLIERGVLDPKDLEGQTDGR